jgi:hypothetical protein
MKDYDVVTQALLEDTAQFLDDHPGFSPVFSGEDAVVCGFQVRECFLSIADMHWLFATRPDSLFAGLAAWTERAPRVSEHG